MAKEYTDTEVEQLVADIREAFKADMAELAKSEDKDDELKKDAADGDPQPDEQPAEAPPAEAAPQADAPAQDAPAEAPPEESSDSSSDSSSSSSSSSSDSSSSDSSSDSEDEKSLEDAYGALDDDALKAHYDAIKAVIMGRMGNGEGDEDAPAQEAAPAQNAAPPVDAPPDALKSEKDFSDKLSKTEDTLSKAQGEITELKSQLEKVVGVFEAFLSKPQRRAVTSMAELQVVNKSETQTKPLSQSLTKAEIINRLNKKTATPDLSKSDRELINGYCLGSVKVADIEHLLK